MAPRSRIPCLAFCVAALLLAPAARAQSTVDGEPLCTARGEQIGPVVTPDGAGGAVVAWSDLRGGHANIYAQRVDHAGLPLWGADGIPVCSARGDQTSLDIAPDGAGGAVVVWHDYRCGSHVYAQRVDADGHTRWAAQGVALCSYPGFQLEPRCAPDGTGGAIVVWKDSRPSLFAQRIDGDGALRWGADGVPVETYFGTDQAIIADGAGGAIIAYATVTAPLFAYFIHAQKLDATGALAWGAAGVAVTTLVDYSLRPALAPDSQGGAILAWADGRAGNAIHIFAQRLSAAGAAQWGDNGVAVCIAPHDQDDPAVCPDGAQGAVVGWQDGRSGVGLDVYASRLSPAGISLWGADGVPVCTAPGDQSGVRIAPDGAGGAALAWQDARGGGWDVYAQRLTASGAGRWTTNGLALSAATGDQSRPALAATGQDAIVAAWTDARVSAAASDIYAWAADSTGAPPAAVDVPPQLPRAFRLWPAFPNPARAATRISFELAGAMALSIDVLDLRGRTVRSLATVRTFAAGLNALTWDARDARGAPVAAGLYFVRVQAGKEAATCKIVVAR